MGEYSMFPYYSSKKEFIKYYPKPKHKKIIEPFAGSAAYSLVYWDNDIIISDNNQQITSVWEWLINQASEKDIKNLPKLKSDADCIEQINLIDLISQMELFDSKQKSFRIFSDEEVEKNKSFICENLKKIKHWKVLDYSYYNVYNEKATWFIDPPVQHGFERFEGQLPIDYEYLKYFCEKRKGQIIVCADFKSNWMNFNPLIDGIDNNQVIWSNHVIEKNKRQTELW